MRMDTRIISAAVLIFLISCFNLQVKGDNDFPGLSFEFYNKTCPQLEKIVEEAIFSMSKEDPQIPAALVRLLYNDCAVGGCDASILVDKNDINKSEIGSSNNFGIIKRELIGQIKSRVEQICPEQVSCADILVLAAREAIAVSEGPKIRVPLGRRDSSVAYSNYDADDNVAPANTFARKSLGYLQRFGLTYEESVALLGAHTLGTSHCTSIRYRIEEKILTNFDKEFVERLNRICPKGAASNTNTSLPNDRTPHKFDNDYFAQSLGGRVLLVTDVDLGYDPFTVEYVARFVTHPNEFFVVFSSAFVKLSSSLVLTGKDGEIRKQCNRLNGA